MRALRQRTSDAALCGFLLSLFVLTPFPHILYALNAFDDPVGSLKWRYTPDVNPAAASLGWSGTVAVAPALVGDAAYINTRDGHNWDVT